MKILVCLGDFLLINMALSVHGGIDINSIIWYSVCIVLGFSLRLGILIKEGKYSHRMLLLHGLFTICWCFIMVLLWRTWLNTTWINRGGQSFEIYLFINSLFSFFLVSQLEYFFKVGFIGWMKLNLGKLLAKDMREDQNL